MGMPELKCTVQTCVHNKQFYCDLDGIEVTGGSAKTPEETSCGSFVERKGEQYSNVAGEASAASNIDCKAAECMYNESYKCHAGKISIEGSSASRQDETECAAFQYNQ